jgi:hypothetical protein
MKTIKDTANINYRNVDFEAIVLEKRKGAFGHSEVLIGEMKFPKAIWLRLDGYHGKETVC